MVTNHEENYRMSLPLGIVFALASVAATVIFIVYAIEWSEQPEGSNFNENYQRATFSYYAAVISLLTLIVFFNGYHLTKITI